jgi:hypothetical protein
MTGDAKTSDGKPLSYKGSSFHRSVCILASLVVGLTIIKSYQAIQSVWLHLRMSLT